mgnify:CR=1 FL=1
MNILKKINSFSQSKQYKEYLNPKLLEEVVNIVEDPNLPQYTRMQVWSLVSQLERK